MNEFMYIKRVPVISREQNKTLDLLDMDLEKLCTSLWGYLKSKSFNYL